MAERVAYHLLGAVINAIPVQNALAVFHRAILDHRVDIQVAVKPLVPQLDNSVNIVYNCICD